MTDTSLFLDEDLERPVVSRPQPRPRNPPVPPLSATVRYPLGPVPDVADDVPSPRAATTGWRVAARGPWTVLPARPWPRSRVVAGLLGVLVGALGLHAVYLGKRRRGLAMLATTLVGGVLTFGLAAVAMGLWGFTEGLLVLCTRRGRFARDAWGRPLV